MKRPWDGEDAQFPVPWQSLSDGDLVPAGDDQLTVIHTPGHSPDHLAFWHEPSATIFSGDLVVRGSSVMIHTSRGGNLLDYLRSLQRLLLLEPAVLLPAAHENVRAHLEKLEAQGVVSRQADRWTWS